MAQLMADTLMILHFFWVLFMFAGFPIAVLFRISRLRLLHALGLVLYIFLAVLGWYCPLTVGEEYFRQLHLPSFSYHGSFLATWAERIIYVENWGAPLWIFWVLAAVYLSVCLSSWWWLPRNFFQKGRRSEKK